MRNLIAVTAMAIGQGISGPAAAGPFTDELSKCLVKSTSAEDRIALVRWMFAALAAHPGVADVSVIPPQEMTDATVNAAGLFQRLLLISCRDQTVEALKYEKEEALRTSFGLLGRIAAVDLFESPEVKAEIAKLASYMDEEELEKLVEK